MRPRVVPSRKLVDKLTSNAELYKGILTKLIGNVQLDSLANLSREELLQLALASPEVTQGTSPSVANARAMSEIHTGSDGADSLEALEQAPPEDPYWDEARKHQIRVQGISDDVNGLSMSVDRLSSYVGISSITAALKVIVRCAPQARPLLTHNNQTETALPSRANSPPPELTNGHPLALPSQQEGERLIESYFDRCHPFFPLIDERKFWATYLHGNRTDPQWLALLNIVFAVGSLASSTADNQAHYTYFNRSRRHMSLDSFGSGNIEVLQALGIMCGYYMHYLNRPNEAHSLMGGTLRMATSLGLHREYSERSDTGRQLAQPEDEEEAISPEMRRRMWWSLFCLDAWASTTTGRPSLGRMGPSITVMRPGTAANAVPTIIMPNSPQFMEQLKLLPLTHASTFCAIATKIQDRLVESPLLPHAETGAYDAQIMKWHEELPSILSSYDEQCPEFLHRVRCVMRWRWHNIRIVLHRPILLTTALRRCAWANLTAEEKIAVEKCRTVASTTIEELSRDCMSDLISGWNAVWFCFQACMVPLVSLFNDASQPEEVEKWKASIETALAFFDRIRDWSIAAKRSADAVSRLYAAYKAQQTTPPQPSIPPTPQMQQQQAFAMSNNFYNNFEANQQPFDFNAGGLQNWPNANMNDPNYLNYFWDDMMWDTNLPDMQDAPFGMSNVYDFTGAAQDSGMDGAYWMHGN
ncbi:hypothetical protein N0V91_002105 [Didymella pomorum]|uniref:Xylanolytic transcriptional activator regulatory domain-containing protein n=1 Tax=Didymella pomorum TaxID=749634 RepID=A0A9W8ZJP2_9PLEO|nr:hypothetical protein N0V91_002105 [Didymella pomorum]